MNESEVKAWFVEHGELYFHAWEDRGAGTPIRINELYLAFRERLLLEVGADDAYDYDYIAPEDHHHGLVLDKELGE